MAVITTMLFVKGPNRQPNRVFIFDRDIRPPCTLRLILDTTVSTTPLDAARKAGYDAAEQRRIDFKGE
jgi:hypothetical protein